MSIINLEAISEAFLAKQGKLPHRVIICAGTGCVANGALKVFEEFKKQAEASSIPYVIELKKEDVEGKHVHISRSGCQGFCQMGPLVTIEPEGILYTKVKPADVAEIVGKTLAGGQMVERLLYKDPRTQESYKGNDDIPFYKKQSRSVLKNSGHIDPECIEEYIAKGGYFAARRAYIDMTPAAVVEEINFSGLRGRGGGGFPTARKWELCRVQPGPKKYIICNGDEGDPGAFMDRSVMEGNPHSVLEGMMIAARAIGADEGYVYVRAEYPLAVERVKKAIAEAEGRGILGDGIFGTEHSLNIHIMEGAGAFVCGEETALIASIEGLRGMPSPKPPFPAQSGLFGKPTVINNVETLASVPIIIGQGAAEFRKYGTAASPGTKTFAITGHVANTGLIEVPIGTTLGEVVYEIGGGVTNDAGEPTDEQFKAVQIGGPSGGCLTPEHTSLPLDFDSLKGVGAMVGSGGLVVMNKNTCMVKIAQFFMQFTQNESCGKCVLCREGTRQMLAMLEDITEGRADAHTLDLLESTAKAVAKASLCGLGKTAPNPVLSTLRHFRAEYEAHVFQKRCPAGQCKALAAPKIQADKCKGCTLCAKKCPVGAISGEVRQPHSIDPDVCIRCGVCSQVCKFGAVTNI